MICRLIARTEAVDIRNWQEYTANLVQPTKLAFLVFEIEVVYEFSEYLVGLYDIPIEGGYLVAGTAHDFIAATTVYNVANDYPHEVCYFYKYVKQTIKDLGYEV